MAVCVFDLDVSEGNVLPETRGGTATMESGFERNPEWSNTMDDGELGGVLMITPAGSSRVLAMPESAHLFKN